MWFYLKQICTASYNYGKHCEYQIIDRNGQLSTVIIGDFALLKFYTHGTQYNFQLTIELKDCRTAFLHKHTLTFWSNEIKTTLNEMREIATCGSYEIFMLKKENERLQEEIKKFKSINK